MMMVQQRKRQFLWIQKGILWVTSVMNLDFSFNQEMSFVSFRVGIVWKIRASFSGIFLFLFLSYE